MGRSKIAISDRFEKYVERVPFSDCWFWTGGCTGDGYGALSVYENGKKGQISAHKFAYEQAYGPAKNNLKRHIDHICNQKLCVNPAHLRVISRKENILRGTALSARYARATHCQEGHPYVAAFGARKGKRYCPVCTKKKRHEYHIKKYHQEGGKEARHERWLKYGH